MRGLSSMNKQNATPSSARSTVSWIEELSATGIALGEQRLLLTPGEAAVAGNKARHDRIAIRTSNAATGSKHAIERREPIVCFPQVPLSHRVGTKVSPITHHRPDPEAEQTPEPNAQHRSFERDVKRGI